MPSPARQKPVRIAIIGTVDVLPGGRLGRSGALALALRGHAGVDVTLRAIAPNDAARAATDGILAPHGITSQVTTRPDGNPAPIRLGDTLDVWGLFAHDVVILDADDAPLRAWITDLPAHTAPGVRILGTLDYVSAIQPDRERDIALRFDAIVGTATQARALFGLPDEFDAESATTAVGAMMRGANLRAAAIHDGASLSIAALNEPPVAIALPATADRDQIIAAFAIAMARRERWITIADLLPG